jgi:integrase
MTFSTLLHLYIESLAGRPSHEKYRQLSRQFFESPAWSDRKANEITRQDILLLKQSLEKTPAHANKVLGLVKQAYRWAEDRIDPATKEPLYNGQNPAWRVTRHDSVSRERLMDRAEIASLLNNIDRLNLKYRSFFVARLLTPCRILELCNMRRDAVDMVTGKWHKRTTKNGRPQWVLVPRQALALLSQLPVEGEFFFMGVYGRPIRPESARKVWVKFRADLGLSDVWLLDFRRTLATYLYTEISSDDLTAKAVLNHYDSRPVAVYTRLNYDRLAEIIQKYADWIWSLKGGKPEHSRPVLRVC